MHHFFSLLIILLLFLAGTAGVSAKSGETEKNSLTLSTLSKNGSLEKDKNENEKEKKDGDTNKSSFSGSNLSQQNQESSTGANETEKKKIEFRLKKDINAYIIESYKAQGNKIIKDLSNKLSKTIPDPDERKVAYEKIQESLKNRLEKIEDTEASDSKKEILQEFLKHLIQLLDKRIDEIEN